MGGSLIYIYILRILMCLLHASVGQPASSVCHGQGGHDRVASLLGLVRYVYAIAAGFFGHYYSCDEAGGGTTSTRTGMGLFQYVSVMIAWYVSPKVNKSCLLLLNLENPYGPWSVWFEAIRFLWLSGKSCSMPLALPTLRQVTILIGNCDIMATRVINDSWSTLDHFLMLTLVIRRTAEYLGRVLLQELIPP
jgi:hypothetical protein